MNTNFMRKTIVFMMFFFLYIGSVQAEADAQTYMIGFTDETELEAFTEAADVKHQYDSLTAVSVEATQDELDDWKQQFAIDWVEADKRVSIDETTEESTWAKESIMSERSRDLNLTGKGVKVAVIDTGINQAHPALSYNEGMSAVPYTDSYEDDHGHGSHVAGIIKADGEMTGVATDVELYIAKVLDAKGDGTESDVLAGIDWAIKQDVDIINLSLSSSEKKPLTAINRLLKQASEDGVIVVASSGNVLNTGGQMEDDILYPARFPFVIGVGSVDQDLKRAKKSYIGPSLQLVAPGEKIYSTYMARDGEVNTYKSNSGTSMATAYASGVIAQYMEIYPDLKGNDLKRVLYANSLDLGEPGKDDEYGYGLIRSPETKFYDLTKDAWYEESIYHLIDNDYVTGFSDATYRPDAHISRGEVATLLNRAYEFPVQRTEKFSDVPASHYAASHIETLASHDIITGYPNGYFGPEDSITRADVAVMIDRVLDLKQDDSSHLTDVEASMYYAAPIHRLYNEGIITGYSDLTYKPEKRVIRAEFSAILAKSLAENLRK